MPDAGVSVDDEAERGMRRAAARGSGILMAREMTLAPLLRS